MATPSLEETHHDLSDLRTDFQDNCEYGDALVVGLETCLSYNGKKCMCKQCHNFHICHVWAPQEYLDLHRGLCVHCNMLSQGIVTTIGARDEMKLLTRVLAVLKDDDEFAEEVMTIVPKSPRQRESTDEGGTDEALASDEAEDEVWCAHSACEENKILKKMH